MKRNSTRSQPTRVIEELIEISRELYARNNNVVLCIDVFYVCGQAFLSTIDKTIKFRAAGPIDDGTDTSRYKALDAVFGCYNKADFYIKTIRCEGEFRSLMGLVQHDMDLTMDNCASGAHFPEAERNNRLIQDRSRSEFYRMPFKAVPRVMVRYLVMRAARSHNWLPAKGGISTHYSPYMVMHHRNLDWNKHFAHEQGSNVQANQDNKPSNNLQTHTLDCIYLNYDYESTDGGHIVMDLATGREIRKPQVKECVMTPLVIKRVEQLAANQGIKTFRFGSRRSV